MKALGFGPSLVDISATLSPERYETCLKILDVEPGGWKRLHGPEELHALVGVLALECTQHDFISTDDNSSVEMTAGSSVLGMLAACTPVVRRESGLVTATACLPDGTPDPLSVYFRKSVEAMDLTYEGVEVVGRNPIGFVLSSRDDPEKILVNYPGVTTELDGFDIEQHDPQILIMDAYELQEGKTAAYLKELIEGGNYKVALSLGNVGILREGLGASIRSYIESGRIHVLAGNSSEYNTIYSENDTSADRDDFAAHPVHDSVPFCLVTYGEQGLTAGWDGKVHRVAAYPPDGRIVNTSGAGDTAAGVFINGVLEGEAPKDVLEQAASLASQTIQVPGSLTLRR